MALLKLQNEFSFFRGNYAIIVVSWILIDFAQEIPATYYALYVLNLGATETILGMIALFGSLALASMQFPGGYLADKFGRRWLVSTMTFGVALSFTLYAIAPSWHFILIGTVLMNFFNSIYQPALFAIVADSLSPEKRGMGFGIIMLITSTSTTPGPLAARFLYDSYGLVQGMRIGYGLVVALFLVAALLRFRLKETFVQTSKPTLREFVGSYPSALKESFAVWKKVPRSMFYLFVSGAIMMFGVAAVQLYLVVYAVNVLLIGEDVWALILMTLPITMIILSIPIGKLIDRINRKVPLLTSYFCIVGSMLLFVGGNVPRLFFSLILLGVGLVMINSASSALQADLTPKESRGKVAGFSSFVNNIVMAVGALTGGFLYEHFSPELPFYIAVAFTIPALIITQKMVQEPKQRQE